MTPTLPAANIDLQLVRVLFTVISERSVSRAALRLGSTQPQVSAQLRRLRGLTGDPLLVRAGTGLVPTAGALALLGPAERLLREADVLFGPARAGRSFDLANATLTVHLATSDYLDPLFAPSLVRRLRRLAPGLSLVLHPLSADSDYRARLASGEFDLVVGNWLQPPGELHLGRLLTDEVVCLVGEDHAAVRQPAAWTADRYLAADHVAPTPLHPGARGVIDDYLAQQGLRRHVAVRSAHFGLVPQMLPGSGLVLTTGRLFCLRHVGRLPVRVVPCPLAFPPMAYYQLWHDRTHASAALRWVREQVRAVARELVDGPAPAELAVQATD
ncbi:LysR family transcriptional regulator [Ideonella livida]|uniref:LysR family transcriptional regulator n=1 Tax=Ideonella livida TaxID=2707176 RepID=A0A7C9PF43_9BURK|nr:LysR family transcriptional regulator [Ideonella livida]NDY90031.1 LysR family transcriptional regulator [Ideonella livida]